MLVKFKSDHCFFIKEKSGLKPNTVRHIDNHDERFHFLIKEWDPRIFSEIEIVCNCGCGSFKSQIKDVSAIDRKYLIISFEKKSL